MNPWRSGKSELAKRLLEEMLAQGKRVMLVFSDGSAVIKKRTKHLTSITTVRTRTSGAQNEERGDGRD